MKRVWLPVVFAVGLASPALAQEGESTPAAEDTAPKAEAPEAEAPTAKAAAEKPAAENPRHGLLGPLRLGVDAALGFPHPLTYGIEALYNDIVSGGLSFGNFKAKADNAEVGISNWDLRARWHPFGGSFFLGAAYGTQTLEASVDEDIAVGETKTGTHLKLKVETTYLTPHLGWFAVWDCGFTLGFDFGYQVALSSKAKDLDVSLDAGSDPTGSDEFKKKEDDLEKAVEGFGKISVPYMTLLRMGWMF